jgi:Aminoglycoside-2''-adenylyltransferase
VVPLNHLTALRKLYDRLNDTPINWAVVGSMSLALQGVPIEPHDIDISTDKAGAYETERLFGELVIKPVAFSSTDKIRSHFGAFVLDGVKVEIMGDVQTRASDGTWFEPDGLRHKRIIEVEGMQVPVLSLEFEYQAYMRLERFEKAEAIQKRLLELAAKGEIPHGTT